MTEIIASCGCIFETNIFYPEDEGVYLIYPSVTCNHIKEVKA